MWKFLNHIDLRLELSLSIFSLQILLALTIIKISIMAIEMRLFMTFSASVTRRVRSLLLCTSCAEQQNSSIELEWYIWQSSTSTRIKSAASTGTRWTNAKTNEEKKAELKKQKKRKEERREVLVKVRFFIARMINGCQSISLVTYLDIIKSLTLSLTLSSLIIFFSRQSTEINSFARMICQHTYST